MPDSTGSAIADLRSLTDLELMRAFQGGDGRAFDVIVRKYQDQITNYAFRFVGNYEDACDIAQETFYRVYKNKMAYQPIAKFSTWLYTIAGNIARSDLRRRRTLSFTDLMQRRAESEERELEIPDETRRPDRATETSIVEEHVNAALQKIPAAYREVIIMRDINDMEYDDIAQSTGLPIGTVKSRINRGRTMLQKLLKDIYQPE